MKILYYTSLTLLLASVLALGLSLFDIIRLSDTAYRVAGVVCLVSLFFFTRSVISLKRSTRKF